jgi:hypothetical protein
MLMELTLLQKGSRCLPSPHQCKVSAGGIILSVAFDKWLDKINNQLCWWSGKKTTPTEARILMVDAVYENV